MPLLRTLASVAGPSEQRLWHSTLDDMERQPGADLAGLTRVRAWITHGVSLDLGTQPSAIHHDNTFSVRTEAATVRRRIQEYIAFEAIVPLPDTHPCPFGVQPLHVIIKPGRKARLVIDLSRNLNDHLRYEYFSYTTVVQAVEKARPGDWFSKLDLSNCFLSFPLHAFALPYFIFRFDDQLYQFTRMPFGLSSAPRICTELLAVPAFAMQQAGIDRSDRYLNDTLLTDSTRESADRSLLIAQTVFTRFGLVVNPKKTEGPAQQLPFLGILLDSVRQTMSCTAERLVELRALLAEAAAAQYIRLQWLQMFIGKLQFVASVLPGSRPFIHAATWRMNETKRAITARQSSRPAHDSESSRRRTHFATDRACVQVDRIMRDDLAFWHAHLSTWDGRQRWRSAYSDPFTFASDASLAGFGFYLQSVPAPRASAATSWPDRLRLGTGYCGLWSASDAYLHRHSSQMIWSEMFAVLACLLTYRSALRDSSVLFHLDNEPDVHTLNRQATRSVQLAGLLRQIYTVAVDENISIRAVHRRGVDNVLADFLSRTELRSPTAIVDAWRLNEHSSALPLLSVYVVHSQQFGDSRARPSSTSSAATR